jgi:medium-chain acyl-[acyl-carrier-protein] hydrolase
VSVCAPSPWVVPLSRRVAGASPARLRLFCFPFAGGGPAAFRAWPDALPAHFELCAIQPPGREARLAEPPVWTLPVLIDHLVRETRTSRDGAFAFFGHSIGALVAFELARELRRRGEALPLALIVSACAAPQLRDTHPLLSSLPEDELLAWLGRLEGTPAEVLADAEMMKLLLPALRADLALRDGYRYAAEPALSLPLMVFGGDSDAGATEPELLAWREHTLAGFRHRTFPGGHFFIRSARPLVLEALGRALDVLPRASGENHANYAG